jgi:hypothetical protein
MKEMQFLSLGLIPAIVDRRAQPVTSMALEVIPDLDTCLAVAAGAQQNAPGQGPAPQAQVARRQPPPSLATVKAVAQAH